MIEQQLTAKAVAEIQASIAGGGEGGGGGEEGEQEEASQTDMSFMVESAPKVSSKSKTYTVLLLTLWLHNHV